MKKCDQKYTENVKKIVESVEKFSKSKAKVLKGGCIEKRLKTLQAFQGIMR